MVKSAIGQSDHQGEVIVRRLLGINAPTDRSDTDAIGRALGLCLFFWSLKAYLVAWYLWSQSINPLDSLPLWQIPLLGGLDLLVCAFLAGGYLLLNWIGAWFKGWQRWAIRDGLPLLTHVAMVLFALASMQVNQIYGWPLDVMHLRAAGRIDTMGSSILAYVGFASAILLLWGIASFHPVGMLIARGLERIRPLQVRWRMWGAFAVVTVLLVGSSVTQLKGLYLHGLKKNALVHFIQYYEPALEPLHVASRVAELQRIIAGREDRLLRPRSLHLDQPLRRDFTFHGDAAGMNVLYVLLESTTSEYIDEKTAPNITRLARNGVSFTQHVTTFSETYKAAYALFYSDYLTELGALPRKAYLRPLPQTSIVELAQRRGYAGSVFHSGYFEYSDLGYIWEGKGAQTMVDADTLNVRREIPWLWGVFEETTAAAMSDWIRQRGDDPFFAIYSPMFPHHPYLCPLPDKPYADTSWENRYRNALHYTDRSIGTLVDTLREQGILERTLIVLVGDHGESVSGYPVGHGLAMTYEELRTPFILSNPLIFPEPQQSGLFTSHLDVAPTLASLLGWSVDPDWLGRDLLAETIEPRQLFVDIDQARFRAVIDNGLLWSIDDKTGEMSIQAMLPDRLAPLDPADPRHALLNDYLDASDLYVPWAIWRHLSRALATEAPLPPAATVLKTGG